jgi:YVTN family beta-propeller protein
LKFVVWLAVIVAFLPVTASSAIVEFAAPAGNAPTEHLRNVYDAVLPSGRIVTPFGSSVVTGTNALGMTLTPDGRFAIVSNDDDRIAGLRSVVDPSVLSGSSLAVIDTATQHVVDRFALGGETFYVGLAAVRDPRYVSRTLIFAAGGSSNVVNVFDLDAGGHITPDVRHVITLAGPASAGVDGSTGNFPATLVASGDGRHIYVIDDGADRVLAIDTATRRVSGTSRTVGFAPFGAALASDRLVVSNEGLMHDWLAVPDSVRAPLFAVPPPDPLRASSLSFIDLTPLGDLVPSPAPADAPAPSLAMDQPPDGERIVGGAHPSSIVVTPDGGYAFVAMTNVDRIATVALRGVPHVVGGAELRLFDRGPYGTQPAAVVLSQDGTRLYVALAGLDAIAVLDARDPLHLHRLGLIPTGWFPSALALTPDDRTLFVLNTKGFGADIGDAANGVWSTLEKIDLRSVVLSATTAAALKNTRDVRSAPPRYPRGLRNVVVILEAGKTFDATLGDLGYGPADPRRVRFGATVTPNLHALANRYGVAGNLFADARTTDVAHELIAGGIATVYAERTPLRHVRAGSAPADGEDPNDYPRAGSIFNDLARHHVGFRDYGDLVANAGDDAGALGADLPAPAVLAGHVDLAYPGPRAPITQEQRAREFIRDFSAQVKAHRQPRYTHLWLPMQGSAPGAQAAPVADDVADSDRALGAIVAYLSRLRSWKNTAIFVLPDDAGDFGDHISADRTYALVISPYAKAHYVGMHHLSTLSVLKTAEQILDVPPIALGDLLATDMSDFFDQRPNARPFDELQVPAPMALGTRP